MGAALFGDPLGFHHPPGTQVRAADIPDLTLRDQVIQRPQGFVHRRVRVRLVQLIKVNPIGVQATQRVFDRSHDIATRGTALDPVIIHLPAKLRGQHDILASTAQRFSELDFRTAPSVDASVRLS